MPTSRAPALATGTAMRPVPQPSSSTGPSCAGGQPLPERDVAPRDGLRVLPVVERRVVVPAVPAFGHALVVICRFTARPRGQRARFSNRFQADAVDSRRHSALAGPTPARPPRAFSLGVAAGASLGALSDRREEHRVLDFDERRIRRLRASRAY